MKKEEVERLTNLERKGMAETAIRDAEQRILELKEEISVEEGKIEKAKERLMEARAYLRSIGEDID